MERLLLVLLEHQLPDRRILVLAIGMDRLVGRQHHAGGIARGDVGIVAERAEGGGDDAVGKALVGDRGYVVDLGSARALGGVEVLAAQL